MISPADLASLEAIYRRIPGIACQRKCQECCGPIPMSEMEYRRSFGQKPVYLPQIQSPIAIDPITGQCPKLGRDGNCMVYESRPAICRLYGVTKAMACPHGCVPKRWLSDAEAHSILDAVRRLSRDAL